MSDAELEVVADGFDDAPTSFTITRTCSGPCEKTYCPMTAHQMHERTGLPLSDKHGRYVADVRNRTSSAAT